MDSDGRAILQVIRDRYVLSDIIDCPAEVGQLLLEIATGLWSCIESGELGNVDVKMIVELLRKKKKFDLDGAVHLALGPLRAKGSKLVIKQFCRIVL